MTGNRRVERRGIQRGLLGERAEAELVSGEKADVGFAERGVFFCHALRVKDFADQHADFHAAPQNRRGHPDADLLPFPEKINRNRGGNLGGIHSLHARRKRNVGKRFVARVYRKIVAPVSDFRRNRRIIHRQIVRPFPLRNEIRAYALALAFALVHGEQPFVRAIQHDAIR